MPLSVNSHWNSTDGDGKLKTESWSHAESNSGSGHLPRAAMAPDWAPKIVNPSTVNQRQTDVLDGSGWSENAEGKVGNKTQVATSSKTDEMVANRGGEDGREMTSIARASDRY